MANNENGNLYLRVIFVFKVINVLYKKFEGSGATGACIDFTPLFRIIMIT
jgi:hypothetical protein